MSGMTDVPPQASAERLTTILRRAGVLERGEVTDVAVETSRETLISRVTRLRLGYHRNGGAGPSHVFFKTSGENTAAALREFGHKEAAFYNVVAVATPPGLLPRCYEAVAESAEHWHIMLEDLTDSHEPLGDWPVPPSIDRWHAVLDAHARFHAFWWDHERLGASVGEFADNTGLLDQTLAAFPKAVATFADRLGDRLSAERRRIYERLIAAAPRLTQRYRSHRNMT